MDTSNLSFSEHLFITDKNFPNQKLEKMYRAKSYFAFGKKVEFTAEQLKIIREEIVRRVQNGIYIFKNRAERKRMLCLSSKF